MHATEIFGIQPSCKLSLLFMKLSELAGYFYYLWKAKSIWKKSKPWKQLSDVSEMNILTLMKGVDIFFGNFSVANMAENRTQCELQTMI